MLYSRHIDIFYATRTGSTCKLALILAVSSVNVHLSKSFQIGISFLLIQVPSTHHVTDKINLIFYVLFSVNIT